MPGKDHHERIFRGDDAMRRLAETPIVLCGAGAIGSNLADTLARQGVHRLTVIDKDRVEEHNISTQTFFEEEIGSKKADAVKNRIYDAVGVEVDAVGRELDAGNIAKLLRGAALVIDGFDNSASRQLITDFCRKENIACLHAGLAADYAEVLWNDNYRVPKDAVGPDVCDYPMARNLIVLCATVAAEVAVRFIAEGQQENYTITFGDLRINAEER